MGFSNIPGRIDQPDYIHGAEGSAPSESTKMFGEQVASPMAFGRAVLEQNNPFAEQLQNKQKSIKDNSKRIQQMLEAAKSPGMKSLEAIKDAAKRFHERNSELKIPALVLLSDHIKLGDSKEVILSKLAQFYPDVTLADEALEFLLEVAAEEERKAELERAKEEMNTTHGREIAAGRNIQKQVHSAAEKGLGTPSSLRDLYRDITGNPRDSNLLFEELSAKYSFKDLTAVTDFLLHALGTDLKAKGPSIPPAQLQRLISETRSLQAILGIYRFFKGRMNLVQTLFSKEGLTVPEELTFENLSKVFIGLVNERYPSADKVLQQARRLGIEDWIIAKIIAFSQLRDAIREVSLGRIYKSIQHRDELYMSIIEALEDLEDELEELLEEQEEKEQEEKDEE